MRIDLPACRRLGLTSGTVATASAALRQRYILGRKLQCLAGTLPRNTTESFRGNQSGGGCDLRPRHCACVRLADDGHAFARRITPAAAALPARTLGNATSFTSEWLTFPTAGNRRKSEDRSRPGQRSDMLRTDPPRGFASLWILAVGPRIFALPDLAPAR